MKNPSTNSLLSVDSSWAKTVMDTVREQSEQRWAALSKEEQLDYFCAVVRRIHQGDVEEGRSYRGVLYDIFGFGPEAYAQAQLAGYLDLHNLIYTLDYERQLLAKYGKFVAEELGINLDDPDQLVVKFFNTNQNERS